MVKELTNILMGINIRENGSKIKGKEKELIFMFQVLNMMVIG